MRKSLVKNAILFLVGFCSYITIEVLFRGYSYPLMGVLGGFTIILLDKINNCISWDMDIALQGVIGSLLITSMELIIGKLSQAGIVAQMWDYSIFPLNYQGIICLRFSTAWFVIALISIFTADAINYYVFNESPPPYYVHCGNVILKFPTKEELL